jgi:hypothetical protein
MRSVLRDWDKACIREKQRNRTGEECENTGANYGLLRDVDGRKMATAELFRRLPFPWLRDAAAVRTKDV